MIKLSATEARDMVLRHFADGAPRDWAGWNNAPVNPEALALLRKMRAAELWAQRHQLQAVRALHRACMPSN